MQENLLIVKEERHFLLRKLFQQQGEVDPTTLTKSQTNSLGSPSSNHEGVTPKKNTKKRNSTELLGKTLNIVISFFLLPDSILR